MTFRSGLQNAKNKLKKSMYTNAGQTYREKPYLNVPRKIIAEKYIAEQIINNGETIFSIDEDKPKFYKWLAVFCLSLTSCIWLFVLRVKNSNTQTQNQPPGMEEYFFDDWSIACKNGKLSLTYISKRDYLLYTIEITENEFLLAKQKKILFYYLFKFR